MTSNIAKHMADTARVVEIAMSSILPPPEAAEAPVLEAMRYACLGGGKKLRPYLVMESSRLFNVDMNNAVRVAAAVEFVHCYSLIHDDLPAMDNSDLRRGRPTVHKKFDEATAILAGDALLTIAFEVLSHQDTHEDAQVRCNLVSALAKAAGCAGMVAGQMMDLLSGKLKMDMDYITRMQRLKTGEMISFSCESGAILGNAGHQQRQALLAYAHDLGLAFQIVDDVLDVEGSEETLGKPTGQDEKTGRVNFVTILGLKRAKEQAHMLASQASQHLEIFGDKASNLKEVVAFVVERQK